MAQTKKSQPHTTPAPQVRLGASVSQALKWRFKGVASTNGKTINEATEEALLEWIERNDKK